MKILIIDDDLASRTSISEFFREVGCEVAESGDGENALSLLEKDSYALVLLDLKLPGISGIDVLNSMLALPSCRETEVVILTGYGDLETAVAALRSGVCDYLLKPISLDHLLSIIDYIEEKAFSNSGKGILAPNLKRKNKRNRVEVKKHLNLPENAEPYWDDLGAIGVFSERMWEIINQAKIYHASPFIPILIEGETGVGKEVIAKIIHFGSAETAGPFIALNCAALNENLFESELFGYEAGAFTGGAIKGKKGKIDLAAGGTIFLDEIGEIPLNLQAKLLRVIEERYFYRVGGLDKIKTDARFICATNIKLEDAVREGSFRKDLYYRLKVGHITIPPLRERREEIVPLAEMFLKKFSQREGKGFLKISEEAAKFLLNYDFWGNIRELRNALEWVVLMYDDQEVKPEHLFMFFRRSEERLDAISNIIKMLDPVDFELPLRGFNLDQYISRIVQKAIEMHQGNKTAAALYLGISRRVLYGILKKKIVSPKK